MPTDPKPLLELKDIRKTFGSSVANESISLQVLSGTIHALVGENGAGKSTLMKILFGIERADHGTIQLKGQLVQFKNAIEAKSAGLGMVHQHFMLAEPILAIDHIFLEEKTDGSFWKRAFQPLSRRKKIQELEKFANSLGFQVPWHKPVSELSVGLQQRLEIIKILYNQSSILILDEPTAVLTPQEVEYFFEKLRNLKDQGKTIIIITHKLKEVMKISDQVTVLRNGKSIATVNTNETSPEKLAELMMGRKPKSLTRSNDQISSGRPALEVVNLSNHALKKVNMTVQAGEVVGLAGIEGNGQSDLLRALNAPKSAGLQSGSISIFGNEISEMATSDLRALGVRFLGEDRQKQSLLMLDNLSQNFFLGFQNFSQVQKSGWINSTAVKESARSVVRKMDVRPGFIEQPIGELSGGNQQKFVVGRELSYSPQLLVAAHPTRGVDIGAIEIIHQEILDLKKQGAGILLASSEIEELFQLSDRILVFCEGEIVKEFKRSEFDEKQIGLWMTGGPA